MSTDPENGGAAVSYAVALFNQRFAFLNVIRDENQSGFPDTVRVQYARNQALKIGDLAKPAFIQSSEFPQFRDFSHFRLAQIYGYEGDKDQAIKYLTKSIRSGYDSRFRLDLVKDFESIKDDPRFLALMNDRYNTD